MKIIKAIVFTVASLLGLLVVAILFVYVVGSSVEYKIPTEQVQIDTTQIKNVDGLREYNGSMLRQNEHGLWDMYLEGRPEERGAAYGALAKELIQYQERTFIERIQSIIPSEFYLGFLRRMVMFSNRNIDDYIPEEICSEVYNMSQVCSSDYDELVGAAYARQLNYHGAHDIGHAMQRYMLVGCTAFAVWDGQSADSSMLVGRNFDFFFGEDFARHKMVVFVNPTEGIPFVSVSWPAMMGVVSGMNMEGLIVTLNAAEGPLNIEGRTPVSILARQIVQYASSIDEAVAIAEQTETFVSEQIFVCSAKERKTAVIEKSPDKMSVIISDNGSIALTNHYQSTSMRRAEPYVVSERRLQRTEQLIKRTGAIDVPTAVAILRDYKDTNDKALPVGSEEALCQFISHHSVVFNPDNLQLWVSTSPWQLGEYVCYDLRAVMEQQGVQGGITMPSMTIVADSMAIKYYGENKKQ